MAREALLICVVIAMAGAGCGRPTVINGSSIQLTLATSMSR